MVEKDKPGDILFFHFSGHGTRIPSLEPGQPFRQDEAIVPCDLNLITDMDLRQLIKGLPKGSSFTILSDSCHSGGLIDKDKEQIGASSSTVKILPTPVHYRNKRLSAQTIHQCLESVTAIVHGVAEVAETVSSIGSMLSGIFGKDVNIKFHLHLTKDLWEDLTKINILFSGCQANETSADVDAIEGGGKAYGAFTNAVLQVINASKDSLSNKQLVMKVRGLLKEHRFQQHPCLYCSDENADALFLGSQYRSYKLDQMALIGQETVVANHQQAVKN